MDPPTIPDLLYTTLPTSPTINTAYTLTLLHDPEPRIATTTTTTTTFTPATPATKPPIWLIFINGLALPQAHWQPTITHLRSLTPASFPVPIYSTTYDRQYQGLSQPLSTSTSTSTSTSHPSTTTTNPTPPSPPPLRPFSSAITELHTLLTHLTTLTPHLLPSLKIITAHSLGVPLARLYIAPRASNRRPTETIHGLLSIDSNIANTDLHTLLPDPSDPHFTPSSLPPDTTLESLQTSRNNYQTLFSRHSPNPENLDRSSLPSLLPESTRPILRWPGRRIALRVLAHDPKTFEEESLKICTKGLTRGFIEPAWKEYNEGLQWLNRDVPKGVVVVEGAGHFVQRDRPDVVAGEVWGVIGEVRGWR